mgnify:CR=1 FL=1
MNILVTGGAGYIGSHTSLALIDKGHEVTIIDNLITGNAKAIPDKASFLNSDIADLQKINALLDDNKFIELPTSKVSCFAISLILIVCNCAATAFFLLIINSYEKKKHN